MASSYKLSEEGKTAIDMARRRKGWKRTSHRWADEAMISSSTLKRFLSRRPVSGDNFIALCEAVGIDNWLSLVDRQNSDNTLVALPSPSRKSSFIVSGSFDEDKRQEVLALLDHLKLLLGSYTLTIRSADSQENPIAVQLDLQSSDSETAERSEDDTVQQASAI